MTVEKISWKHANVETFYTVNQNVCKVDKVIPLPHKQICYNLCPCIDVHLCRNGCVGVLHCLHNFITSFPYIMWFLFQSHGHAPGHAHASRKSDV